MKTKAILIGFAIALAVLAVSCGGSKPSSPEAEQQRSELYEAMNARDIARVEMIADSLSLMTDDLTTDETVAVLLAFLQVHNDAAARKDSNKDLITIRKFVDVYDIAMGRSDGDNLINAFNKAKELNGNLDLQEVARRFKEMLADYDAASGDDSGAAEAAAPKPETPEEKAMEEETRKIEESLELPTEPESPSENSAVD